MRSRFLGFVAGFLLAASAISVAQIGGGGGGVGGGGGGSGTPGGSNTQVQYNNAGSFGGISGATTDGSVLTLVAPVLGAASATTINRVTITAPATAATLTIINNKVFTVNKTLTLDGTDSTTMTFPSTSATVARTDAANTFTGHQTIEGVTSTGATGTGKFVFDGTPTLVTPVLGVATATSINKVALTAPASSATLTIADGKTLTDTSGIGAVLLKGATGGGFAAAVASDIPATTLATGTSVTLSAPREYYVCTGTCTVTPPVPAAGYEFCVMNDDNVSTAITMAAIGSSARYENTARTAYGTAGTGTLVATAVVGNKVCLLGLDSTHYLTVSYNGAWTAN